jgi:hypothetical protein
MGAFGSGCCTAESEVYEEDGIKKVMRLAPLLGQFKGCASPNPLGKTAHKVLADLRKLT